MVIFITMVKGERKGGEVKKLKIWSHHLYIDRPYLASFYVISAGFQRFSSMPVLTAVYIRVMMIKKLHNKLRKGMRVIVMTILEFFSDAGRIQYIYTSI